MHSNAVELIVGILALVKGEIIIVQTSLIGSMLSNLLLVLGMCFFFGGINRLEQHFNVTVAQTAASILALAVGGILIPTAFTWGQGAANPAGNLDEELSYGTAVILLLVYGAYLYFQLSTHKEVYNAPSKKVEKIKGAKKAEGDANAALASIGGFAMSTGGQQLNEGAYRVPDDDEEEPSLTLIGALVTLCCATALIGVCAEFMVDSINEVTTKYHVSEYFVGLILLPIVGNAAEHATAVTVAIKDKMDLAIGVAVGSSMQIALLVLPLMVILGWIIGEDMTLVFDEFQIVVLFVSVVLVNYLIGDGKSRKYCSFCSLAGSADDYYRLAGGHITYGSLHNYCSRLLVLSEDNRRDIRLNLGSLMTGPSVHNKEIVMIYFKAHAIRNPWSSPLTLCGAMHRPKLKEPPMLTSKTEAGSEAEDYARSTEGGIST